MTVAAVILAAGASRRLGRPKQMLVVGGETLVGRAIRVAGEAGLEPIFLVVARGAAWLEGSPKGCTVVENPEADEGMASSVRVGVRTAQAAGVGGVVVLTCDQVLLTAEHLRRLCAVPERVTASGYAGRTGVPAYFPAARFSDLLALHGDTGAREMLRAAAAILDEELALDLDTEAQVAEAKVRFQQGYDWPLK